MFLTHLSICQSCFFVSATPLKPLNRMSWNFVVIKNILHRCANLQQFLIQFFSGNYAAFELRKIYYWTVSLSPLKPLNRVSCNFIVKEDTTYMCICTCICNIFCRYMHLCRPQGRSTIHNDLFLDLLESLCYRVLFFFKFCIIQSI